MVDADCQQDGRRGNERDGLVPNFGFQQNPDKKQAQQGAVGITGEFENGVYHTLIVE